ncbi:hypothetical protein PFISCL1PPCAC_885, partial [Pristionchus fissidentatus]
EKAMDQLITCPAVGFLSMLWIVPVTASKWNVTFSTQLRYASLQFVFFNMKGKPVTKIGFAIGKDASIETDGITRELNGSQSTSEEFPGQTTYTFQLEPPQKVRRKYCSPVRFMF